MSSHAHKMLSSMHTTDPTSLSTSFPDLRHLLVIRYGRGERYLVVGLRGWSSSLEHRISWLSPESHLGWTRAVRTASRGPDRGSNCSVVVHQCCDLDGLPGGALSGVQPDSSCFGGGKTEDSLLGSVWNPGGRKQRPAVCGTNIGAPLPLPPPPPPSLLLLPLPLPLPLPLFVSFSPSPLTRHSDARPHSGDAGQQWLRDL